MPNLVLRNHGATWYDIPGYSEYPITVGTVFNYPLTRDGLTMFVEWWYSVPTVQMIYDGFADPLTSGVLADFLEEWKDELLHGATGPSDPAQRLDALIQYLRSRFHGSATS